MLAPVASLRQSCDTALPSAATFPQLLLLCDTSEATTGVHFAFLPVAVIHLEDGVIPRSVISVHFSPSYPVSRNAFPFHLFFKQTRRYIKSHRSGFHFELIVFYVSKRLWKFCPLSVALCHPITAPADHLLRVSGLCRAVVLPEIRLSPSCLSTGLGVSPESRLVPCIKIE